MVAGERQPVSVTAPRADRVFLVDQLGRMAELKRIVKVVGKEQIQYLDLSVRIRPPQR